MPNISNDAIAGLQSKINGQVVTPHDANYDEVRAIWNAMIDKRPAVFVQCAAAADVPVAVGFARQHGLDISIRGAGHNIAGTSISDGGLVIDHSKMKAVRVDTVQKRAYVEPGATLGDFDATGSQAARTHREDPRHTQQLRVSELDARRFVAVVVEDFVSDRDRMGMERVRDLNQRMQTSPAPVVEKKSGLFR